MSSQEKFSLNVKKNKISFFAKALNEIFDDGLDT